MVSFEGDKLFVFLEYYWWVNQIIITLIKRLSRFLQIHFFETISTLLLLFLISLFKVNKNTVGVYRRDFKILSYVKYVFSFRKMSFNCLGRGILDPIKYLKATLCLPPLLLLWLYWWIEKTKHATRSYVHCKFLIVTLLSISGHNLNLNVPKLFFKLMKRIFKIKYLSPNDSSLIWILTQRKV